MNEILKGPTQAANESVQNQLSKRIINDLNTGKGKGQRNNYLKELNGVEKFPDKFAIHMIRAGRGDVVMKNIRKFEPTQNLAKALLEDMLEKWFYEDEDSRAEGYGIDFILGDDVYQRETFLSTFKKLDNSTALLVLKTLEKNMYEGADATYKLRLGNCFTIKYFEGLDEEVLRKLSERGVIIKDEDKNRFVGIDKEKWDKYTKIALMVQDEANEERDKLDEELNGMNKIR